MKFGKLVDVSQVNFQLPPNPPITNKILNASTPPSTKIYTGATGWSMKEWVGSYYPKGTKTTEFLREYAKQFTTIELNTTHYRIPNDAMIQKWYQETPDYFKFAPKMPQSISHSNDLGMSKGWLKSFLDAVAGLKEKLGVIFMQLPPYFDKNRLPLLQVFLERFPSKDFQLAIEVRHESWFEEGYTSFEPLANLLQKHQIATVLTDVAGRRDVLHMSLTTPQLVLRWVGNALVPSDYGRLQEWMQRLNTWQQKGLEEAYLFFHQPDNILTPDITAHFTETMNQQYGMNLLVPKKHEDGQFSLF